MATPARDQIIQEIRPVIELFQDNFGEPWVGLPKIGKNNAPLGQEYTRLKTLRFREYVSWVYYKKHQKSVGSQAVQDAIDVLAGMARLEPVRDIFIRVANLPGQIFVDLCNKQNQVVKIDKQGWTIINNPPVVFKRLPGMKPLPIPEYRINSNGTDKLEVILNLDRNSYILVMAWLLAAYFDCDFPILNLNGEHGSGKSTITEVLKSLVDPNQAMTRAAPRNEHELMISADNSYVLALDNLSSIQDWQSDALCRLSTGAGWSTRRLYSDQDEIILSLKRPIILNGITEIVTRPDLLSRSLIVTVPPIAHRRPKSEFWKEYEAALPVLLAEVFDALAIGLKEIDQVSLSNLPRMTDFARWAVAALPGIGIDGQEFLRIYDENVQNATIAILDYSILASEIQELIKNQPNWSGSAQELLSKLYLQTSNSSNNNYFEKILPHKLVGELKRLVPALKQISIDIEFLPPAKIKGKVKKMIKISSLNVAANVAAKVSVP